MREHDISQLPIIESGEVVGSLSETRILKILVADSGAKRKPVAEYMEKPFPVVVEDASLTDVSNQLDRDTGAVLVRNASGFDIITRADLIFFLTKQKT